MRLVELITPLSITLKQLFELVLLSMVLKMDLLGGQVYDTMVWGSHHELVSSLTEENRLVGC